MIYTLLNFGWIFISTFLLGFGFLTVLGKCFKKNLLSTDFILITGLMAATVYAQVMSLIYKVRTLASLILFLMVIVIAVLLHRTLFDWIKKLLADRCRLYRSIIVLILLTFMGLIVASQPASLYDTGLYHAQAIHWIEDYGYVKGLGNLHNRFAYNSSFLCLQALYSWVFVNGQSLHGMNAYVGIVMAGYALLSFQWRKRTNRVAGMLNLALLLYICNSLGGMESPGTDFFAMCLMLYLLARWFRCQYKEEKYILCILAAFGVTLKLSIAPVVLLAAVPAIWLIKGKKWKETAVCLGSGFLTVLPFLVRNVMISGYLIYPYTALDIFSVDWKMPEYTVNRDRNEIMAWGRELRDVNKIDYPIWDWFPIWFQELTGAQRALFLLNVFLIVIVVWFVVRELRKKRFEMAYVCCVAILGLAMWFFSAPLIRYGRAYLYILPAVVFGLAAERIRMSEKVCRLISTGFAVYFIFLCGQYLKNQEFVRIVFPEDYSSYSVTERMISDEISIYTAEGDDRTGYEPFPAIPYATVLDRIELRGDSLENGFRIREEYRNTRLSNDGRIE